MELKLDAIRYEMNEAMRKIGEKHGFTASIGSITYGDTGFHCTLTALVNDTGNGKSGAQLEYEMYARKFNIEPSTFGKHFFSNGKEFVVTGINKNARTMPVLAQDVETGAHYKFSAIAAGVQRLINKDALNIKNHVFGGDDQ